MLSARLPLRVHRMLGNDLVLVVRWCLYQLLRRPNMAEHGTRGGYAQHGRDKTPTCDECRRANRDHQHRLREKKAAERPSFGVGSGRKRGWRARFLYDSTWDRVEALAISDGVTCDIVVGRMLDLRDLGLTS